MEIRLYKDKKLDDCNSWPVWTCKPSEFEWFYKEEEHCYIIEGSVTVESKQGTISIERGDYVIFPKGLKCHWTVHKYVKKHYTIK